MKIKANAGAKGTRFQTNSKKGNLNSVKKIVILARARPHNFHWILWDLREKFTTSTSWNKSASEICNSNISWSIFDMTEM